MAAVSSSHILQWSKHLIKTCIMRFASVLTHLNLWADAETHMAFLVWEVNIHILLRKYVETDAWPHGEEEGLEWKVAHMWVKIQPVPTPPHIAHLVEAQTSNRGYVQPLKTCKRKIRTTKKKQNISQMLEQKFLTIIVLLWSSA